MHRVDRTPELAPFTPKQCRARSGWRWLVALSHDDRGLSTVEYVILLALIAVVGIGVWKSFGETLIGKVNQANTTFQTLGE